MALPLRQRLTWNMESGLNILDIMSLSLSVSVRLRLNGPLTTM